MISNIHVPWMNNNWLIDIRVQFLWLVNRATDLASLSRGLPFEGVLELIVFGMFGSRGQPEEILGHTDTGSPATFSKCRTSLWSPHTPDGGVQRRFFFCTTWIDRRNVSISVARSIVAKNETVGSISKHKNTLNDMKIESVYNGINLPAKTKTCVKRNVSLFNWDSVLVLLY